MTLQVIGSGFGRTGTMSLKAALGLVLLLRKRLVQFAKLNQSGNDDDQESTA